MINGATVMFTNGKVVDVERVKFKSNGWVGLRATDGWVYYTQDDIGRIVNPDADAESDEVGL